MSRTVEAQHGQAQKSECCKHEAWEFPQKKGRSDDGR